MTLEQLAFFTEQTRRAVHHALRRYTAASVVGFLILLAGVGYSIHDTAHRSYRARSVLCTLITRSDVQLYHYADEGAITQDQLHRSLRLSAESRHDLQPGSSCSDSITPVPSTLTAAAKHPR